jgi:hypothetical protein
MKQITRRLGGSSDRDLLHPPDAGAVEISLEPDAPGKKGGLPKIKTPKRKEFQVPERLGDDPGYVERMFPRSAKKRNETQLFQKKLSQLQAVKVTLIENLDSVDLEINQVKEHNRDLQERQKQLMFQDNIMTERRLYSLKIEELKQRLRKVLLESARLDHYKGTLNVMMERLHEHQITYIRTQKTYKRAVSLQRKEANEFKKMAEESRSKRDAAEKQLRDIKRKTRRKE